MKVLVTGMTSAQCNPTAHRRSHNFTGLLWDTLRTEDHHEVFWRDPSVWMDDPAELKKYDRVFVGVAPISALGANRAYGALSIIQHLWFNEKLVLVVDAPEPNKMQTALNAVMDHPDNLVKPFFSYRKDYNVALSSAAQPRLLEAVKMLATLPWPTTIAPGLPWMTQAELNFRLPLKARDRVTLHNFDHMLLNKYSDLPKNEYELRKKWVYEPGSNPKWKSFGQVSWEKTELPRTHRVETNTLTTKMLRGAGGCLISPTQHGTWWTPRYSMSMAVHTPVFTEWKESWHLDHSWSELPTTFETYSNEGQLKVAAWQREAWMDRIPSREKALTGLYEAIHISERPARRKRKVVA